MSNENERKPLHGTNQQIGIGVLGRYPIASILLFAFIGIGCGYGLSLWLPDDETTKKVLIQWIGVFGDIFIRLLTCFVLPLVFVTVSIAIIDMLYIGKASEIGLKVIGLYALTTSNAALVGVLCSALFTPFFHTENNEGNFDSSLVRFQCNNNMTFITEMEDGSLICAPRLENYTSSETFLMEDINGYFQPTINDADGNDKSLSDQLYEGVILKLFTNNIFSAFTEANFAGVVVFALIFGFAVGSELMNGCHKREGSMESVMKVMSDIDKIFVKMLTWVISLTPFAVLSLIMSAIGNQVDLISKFLNVGLLVGCVFTGYIIHALIIYIGLHAAVTRSNPIEFFRKMVPAQAMAFSCGSSAATLPLTMKCLEDYGKVPEPIWRFILPIGATVNLDGISIYLISACVWMATYNGINVTLGDYILLAILGTLGSIGAAPVPQAGLVLIVTAYNTAFNTVGTPNGFEFIIAIDWLIDRVASLMNVTSDTVICRLVGAKATKEETRNSFVESIHGSMMIPCGLTASMILEQEQCLAEIDAKYHSEFNVNLDGTDDTESGSGIEQMEKGISNS